MDIFVTKDFYIKLSFLHKNLSKVELQSEITFEWNGLLALAQFLFDEMKDITKEKLVDLSAPFYQFCLNSNETNRYSKLMNHQFFSDIDWDLLVQKKMKPPERFKLM